MKVMCLVCGAELITVTEPSSGIVTHCSVPVRFFFEGDKLVTFEHSKRGYDPSPIFYDKSLSTSEKLNKLRRLSSHMRVYRKEYQAIIGDSAQRCYRFMEELKKRSTSSITISPAKDRFKDISVKKMPQNIAITFWQSLLAGHITQHHRARASELIPLVENSLKESVKYSNRNGIPLPNVPLVKKMEQALKDAGEIK